MGDVPYNFSTHGWIPIRTIHEHKKAWNIVFYHHNETVNFTYLEVHRNFIPHVLYDSYICIILIVVTERANSKCYTDWSITSIVIMQLLA